MKNIEVGSINAAIQKLKTKCVEEIKKLREESNYNKGRLLGLWSQQLANVVLFLKE